MLIVILLKCYDCHFRSRFQCLAVDSENMPMIRSDQLRTVDYRDGMSDQSHLYYKFACVHISRVNSRTVILD